MYAIDLLPSFKKRINDNANNYLLENLTLKGK